MCEHSHTQWNHLLALLLFFFFFNKVGGRLFAEFTGHPLRHSGCFRLRVWTLFCEEYDENAACVGYFSGFLDFKFGPRNICFASQCKESELKMNNWKPFLIICMPTKKLLFIFYMLVWYLKDITRTYTDTRLATLPNAKMGGCICILRRRLTI